MTLIDLLVKYPVPCLIIAILVIFSIVSIIALVYVLSKKLHFNDKGKHTDIKNMISTEFEGKIQEYEQLRTFYDDQRDEINKEIWDMERNGTMEKYMQIVEDKLTLVIKCLKESHEALLYTKIEDKMYITIHPDIKQYQHIMRNVYWELKESLRSAMRRNGFTKKSTDDLSTYASEKLEMLYNIIELLTDTDYNSTVISIQELRDNQRRKASIYGKILMSIFIEAKSIAVKIQSDVDMLRKVRKLIQDSFSIDRKVLTVIEAKEIIYSIKKG